MSMKLARFVWEKAHWVTRIPGVYRLYLTLTNWLYPDGKVVTISNGPLAGWRWQRFRCHQAWMAMGLYEPHVTQLIETILQPGDVFYDVGANAGYYTLVAARKVGPSGRVIAFEPVPFNAQVIEQQIALNHLQEFCCVEPLAISDAEGVFSLVVPDRNANAHLAHIAAPHISAPGQAIDVAATTLDRYVVNHPRPTLIKMDIEGAEVAALRGAVKLLTDADAPIMLVSTHSHELDLEVQQILTEHGYEMIHLPGFTQMVYARKPVDSAI